MSIQDHNIELADRLESAGDVSRRSESRESPSSFRNESHLPPVDRGFGAWSYLIAAFMVDVVTWGFPNSFGVFLESYLNDKRLISQPNASFLLPLIGPLSSGIIYTSALVVYPTFQRYPHYRRKSACVGGVLCCLSLLGASFARTVSQLVALQGVLYAIGGSLLFCPSMHYLSEWFTQRKGLANGLIFSGASVGGLALPLILPVLIRRYGNSVTLRILSAAYALVLVCTLPFFRGRLPVSRSRAHGPSPRGSAGSIEWLKNPIFWMTIILNTCQGFGFFIPGLWLPTFASELNVSSSQSSITVAVLNAGAIIGRIALGFLSDRFNPWVLAMGSLFSSSLVTFVLWGVLSHTIAGLVAFGVSYGLVAGGWSSLWTSFIRPIAKDDITLSTSLFGYLQLTRGLGNIFSTPISSLLSTNNASAGINATVSSNTGFEVGGGKFEHMIVYVGTCFAGAAVIALLGWGVDCVKQGDGDSGRSGLLWGRVGYM